MHSYNDGKDKKGFDKVCKKQHWHPVAFVAIKNDRTGALWLKVQSIMVINDFNTIQWCTATDFRSQLQRLSAEIDSYKLCAIIKAVVKFDFEI